MERPERLARRARPTRPPALWQGGAQSAGPSAEGGFSNGWKTFPAPNAATRLGGERKSVSAGVSRTCGRRIGGRGRLPSRPFLPPRKRGLLRLPPSRRHPRCSPRGSGPLISAISRTPFATHCGKGAPPWQQGRGGLAISRPINSDFSDACATTSAKPSNGFPNGNPTWAATDTPNPGRPSLPTL